MSDPARFWDRMSARYAARPVPDAAVYQRKLMATQERLRPDWDMLEIGCGTGTTALAHARFVAHVRAVDFSDGMLEFGRARAARDGIDNITFEQASLDDIATTRGYDAVLMLSLLHLLPDWRDAIAKAWALTRPGGIFVSSTACLATAPLALRLVLPLLRPTGLAPRISVFSPDELARTITAQGFEIEERWQPGPRDAVFIIARRPAPE
jgi:2-polyprenyl-3-methyl-5-hydroxy-6-metoxy-1,4-benzoquinol methylase